MFENLGNEVRAALNSSNPESMRNVLQRLSTADVLKMFDALVSNLTASKCTVFRNEIVVCIGTHFENNRQLMKKSMGWIEQTLCQQPEGDTSVDHIQRAEAAHLLGCVHNLNYFISEEKLHRLGDRLVAIATDPQEDKCVRHRCIESLGRIGYRAATQALVGLKSWVADEDLDDALDATIRLLNGASHRAQPLTGISGPAAGSIERETIYGREILQLMEHLERRSFTTNDCPKTEEVQVNDTLVLTIKTAIQSDEVIISISIARTSVDGENIERRECDLFLLEFQYIVGDSVEEVATLNEESCILFHGQHGAGTRYV
jgi:hypothetical protein